MQFYDLILNDDENDSSQGDNYGECGVDNEIPSV